jgi:uncharacterized membrane protein YhdT
MVVPAVLGTGAPDVMRPTGQRPVGGCWWAGVSCREWNLRKDTKMPSDLLGYPALRGSSWNLVLLVPLLVLVTPLYNSDEPRLYGFPLFYWLPLLFIPLSVICVALVYQKTKNICPAVEPNGIQRARR